MRNLCVPVPTLPPVLTIYPLVSQVLALHTQGRGGRRPDPVPERRALRAGRGGRAGPARRQWRPAGQCRFRVNVAAAASPAARRDDCDARCGHELNECCFIAATCQGRGRFMGHHLHSLMSRRDVVGVLFLPCCGPVRVWYRPAGSIRFLCGCRLFS